MRPGSQGRRVVRPPATVDAGGPVMWTLASAEPGPHSAADAGTRPAPAPAPSAGGPAPAPGTLPGAPDSESDWSWGDGPGSNDARLEREVPPHW
ncbi:MAG: hypothetical protein LBT54_06480 [Bifidobacteriaceae bacterium]|nr:hypothetical protein [Bifidobacteriaceae bacterium]